MRLLPGSVHVNKWCDKPPVSAFKKHGVRRHMAATMAYLICSRWRKFGKLTFYKTQSLKGKLFFKKICINYSFFKLLQTKWNSTLNLIFCNKIKLKMPTSLILGARKIKLLENGFLLTENFFPCINLTSDFLNFQLFKGTSTSLLIINCSYETTTLLNSLRHEFLIEVSRMEKNETTP